MTTVRMIEPGMGMAIFDEIGSTGPANDPFAPRNAPLADPASHLDKIYLHSDLDPMEVAFGPTNVGISHAAIAAASYTGGGLVGFNGVRYFDVAYSEHLLITHGLGYVPDFLLIDGDDVVYPGQPVQALSDGRDRRIAAYATTTEIRLREWYVRTNASIPAVGKTYTVVVFKRPPEATGDVLWSFDEVTGIVTAALGKFRSDRRYLQVVPGGSPYGFSLGRTIDMDGGVARYVDPDGSVTDPAPLQLKMQFAPLEPSGAALATISYEGSFTGAPAVLVQVP